MSTPIRLGIIGTGIAARKLHWPRLERMRDRFAVVAVCNHTRQKAEEFAALTGTNPRIFTDYRELLTQADVEAVDIALPIALNGPAAREALRAGKHVMVEKPIAGDLAGGEAVVAEARARPAQVLLVAENMRYEPRIVRARGMLDDGCVGQVRMLHAEVVSSTDPNGAYAGTLWRQQPEHLGGYLSDGGVHQIAVLHTLAGPVEAVQALVTSFGHAVGPDTMLVNLRFVSDVIGHLTYSVAVYQRNPSPLCVYGTTGTLKIYQDRITVASAAGGFDLDIAGRPNGLDVEFQDFYDCVRGAKRPWSGAAEGLQDLRVVDAALRSARDGTEIVM